MKKIGGFLKLVGYYRNFIKGFGTISKPSIDLIEKNSFVWNGKTQKAFDKFKSALYEALGLALSEFNKTFVLETNTCNTRLRAIPSQKRKPLSFFSEALSLRHTKLSIYEKEYLEILMAIEKRSHYLK